ncbi:hypothetical protein I3843_07G198500 [Carya illinoinensis]|uniref:SAWADEE domain-containing protein n=1 Tax=Carya illinoinensis TaxID=32201 RepID=A0A8T1PYE8_CARIL|nr:protein SAWADEE HOMEODOMAIN HOMOLOG 1-like isoform X1 [Carya illinoinensis]KAG2699612.1 hypothetical protein I3760_07G199400 [Carya illinoinensis]KAG6649295.1 hypothetical protein CIPAW_07G202400 [Carya illinoinensis]KAG6649296.1 hypothetical protein CIPAW_07G202400 [Carya illinoinensis]KAG6705990.1 hypothetical protein I3842_07G205000 [Carya illinoinensis]KAG7972741.1 hypothetical protein I3843_07G198500 [Carya illinoinensis]
MDRLLRPRERHVFSGFTKPEIDKMETMLEESEEQLLNQEFCKKIAKKFNRSSGRAGKPIVKWTEVHSWFQNRQKDAPKNMHVLPKVSPSNGTNAISQVPKEDGSKAGARIPDLSDLEFEARSSKDGAWYDVDIFIGHRFLGTGEVEVRVRFVGFGAEEDEWVNVKKSVRQRSIPLDHSECHKVKEGDLVLCFQERRDCLIYYDAHVLEIQRRLHDIRGCRCLFLIRYDHDNTEERVRLRRLCGVRC